VSAEATGPFSGHLDPGTYRNLSSELSIHSRLTSPWSTVVTARAGDADTCAQANPGGGCREPGHRATCSADASDRFRDGAPAVTGSAVEIDVEDLVAGAPPAVTVCEAEPEDPQAVVNVEATTTMSNARSGRRWRRDRTGIEPLTGTHLDFI